MRTSNWRRPNCNRGISFQFRDHEIAHSIYFYDPDGVMLEITTYDVLQTAIKAV
jgi:catechol 2,3-dioxygenase-like lactoylglutathione lyase family enzyme